MSLFHGSAIPNAASYDIDNSCRFNNNAHFAKQFSSAGNKKTWTWSCWIKLGRMDFSTDNQKHIFGAGGGGANSYNTQLLIYQDGRLRLYASVPAPTVHAQITTNRVLRDSTQWYHIMCVVDTTQSTASNRVKLYVNGAQETSLSETTYPSQNLDLYVGNNASGSQHNHTIGASGVWGGSTKYAFWDGYMAECYFIDGTALTPSSFGKTDPIYGNWIAKEPSGLTYGTNGFHLDFQNNTSMGNDANGSNNWTGGSNISTHDQMLDTPTNNFCTMNPLAMGPHNTMSEGNLQWHWSSNGNYHYHSKATFTLFSGKWYWEIKKLSSRTDSEAIGITSWNTQPWKDGKQISSQESDGVYSYSPDSGGKKWKNGSGTAYGASWAQNDVFSVALDLDNGTITFYKNGTSQGTAYSDLSSSNYLGWSPAWSGYGTSGPTEFLANFGADGTFAGIHTAGGNSDDNGYGNFKYDVPAGFLALCTKNLPDPTFKPKDHFQALAYTGNGSTNNITGVGFQPDFVWTKARQVGPNASRLIDAVRGATHPLVSNSTATQTTETNGLSAFGSDGYTLNGSLNSMNANNTNYVSWNWKANGAGSSNTDGTITSTVSANTTAGFSIVKWEGDSSASATVGHGLGSQLKMIICREIDGADWWHVWVNGMTDNGHNAFLNNDNGQRAAYSDGHVQKLNNTTTFGFQSSTSNVVAVNQDGINNIAYCFAEIEGYSRIDYYMGNDLTDGHFLYTGFQPAFIMVKRIDTGGTGWIMMDNARDTYNVMNNSLYADTNGTENSERSTMPVDFYSNGFKWRINYSDVNGSTGGSYHRYVFYAVAEYPFKHSNAR